ncbi:MAG TPA: hypothetical protein VJB97_01950 [Candidatus Paceibacterota bacterium]
MDRTALFSTLGLVALFAACTTLFFFHDLSYSELQKEYVPGVHGVHMLRGEGLSFDPWEPLEKNLSLEEMLKALCGEVGLDSSCYLDHGMRFRTFEKKHIIDGALTLHRTLVPLSREEITPALLDERIHLIAQWLKLNQRPDGSLPYLYFPSTDSYSADDNAIRQLITVQGIFALATALDDTELQRAGEKAEARALQRWIRGSAGFSHLFDYDGRSSLGASALAVLVMRGHDTGVVSERERQLGEYLLLMQRPNGSFQTFLDSPASTENERFYSGEALTALARLASASDDTRYDDALTKGHQYYWEKLRNDFSPQYAPWHMQAYALAYLDTKNEEYAHYVFWLADGLIETMLEGDKALPDEDGRFFNRAYPDWGPPHSASTGIYVEGLTYAYEVAEERGDTKKMERYADAILRGTRSLLQLQWTPETAYYVDHPDRVVGSFKVSVTNNTMRIDQVGHAANALVRVRALSLTNAHK